MGVHTVPTYTFGRQLYGRCRNNAPSAGSIRLVSRQSTGCGKPHAPSGPGTQ